MLKLKIEQGLRLRVALALAIFCIVVVGTLGASLYVASYGIEEDHIEQVIEMEMDHLVQRYRQHADFIPQIGPSLKNYVVRNQVEESSIPSYLQGLVDNQYHNVRHEVEDKRVLIRNTDQVRFIVAYEIALHKQRLIELQLLIITSLLVVVVVAFVAGYFLAGLLIKQVSHLAERVRLLVPGDGQVTALIQPGMDEEVAQLARALDDYQNRIKQMLQREQEFTANISHELRTPITTILTSCELLTATPDLSDSILTRISMIETAAARMGAQIQALLFLARDQALGVLEPVAIAESVGDVMDSLLDDIHRKGLQFEMNVAKDVVLTINHQALHILLMNLLRNAVQYTESGFVRVEYDQRRLTISDSGVGIEPDYLPHLYERFIRGSEQGQDLGIGLAIVKRICHYYNWTLEVDSTPGQGTSFYIIFP